MARLSKKVEALEGSPTVAISDMARRMKEDGVDIINLGGGDPDFPTPEHIVTAAFDAIRSGYTHYVASEGIPLFREAIAEKFLNENDIAYSPEEILVTSSGKLALFIALQALLNEGDEAIVIEPAWVSYAPLIELVGATPVSAALSPRDDFLLTREVLERACSPKTSLVIVNSPNNPTGRVLSSDEMNILREFAADRDLWVVSDEIYEKILYGGARHISIASLEGMRERTVTINGMSKSHAMTGWRLGYTGAPAKIHAQLLKVQQQILTCAPAFVQMAGVAALRGGRECVDAMVREYDERRKKIAGMLDGIDCVRCPEPEGAFYFFPEIDYKGMDSFELTKFLLEQAHVAVTPGQVFSSGAVKNVRMTYATSMRNLEQAAQRIAAALK